MTKRQDLPALERNPFLFNCDHWDWKEQLLPWCCWGKPRVRLPVGWFILPPVAAVSTNIPDKNHKLDITTDLGRITRLKWRLHFNTSSRRRNCSHIVQEDISRNSIALWNPKIKLKFKSYLCLFSSFSNSFAVFMDKENANELNGCREETNRVRHKKTTSYETRPINPTKSYWSP